MATNRAVRFPSPRMAQQATYEFAEGQEARPFDGTTPRLMAPRMDPPGRRLESRAGENMRGAEAAAGGEAESPASSPALRAAGTSAHDLRHKTSGVRKDGWGGQPTPPSSGGVRRGKMMEAGFPPRAHPRIKRASTTPPKTRPSPGPHTARRIPRSSNDRAVTLYARVTQ